MADLMIALSLCNTVKIQHEPENKWQYQASSPDELALVLYSQEMGYEMYHRMEEETRVKVQGIPHSYDELAHLPFNSDIRRMGLVVRHRVTKQVIFYLKGADSSMVPILKKVFVG